MDAVSADVCSRLVDVLNQLPGARLPAAAGGGVAVRPRGVVHLGDVVDSGDKRGALYEQMTATEFAAFEREFGLSESDGRLEYPVYELHGNHDGPRGGTLSTEGMMRRNRLRTGVDHVSPSGLSYAWSWGALRLASLGIVIGERSHEHPRRYDPFDSLQFLRADLALPRDESPRGWIALQHIDVLRYSRPAAESRGAHEHAEWHPADVAEFQQLTQAHPILADFHGHTHARHVYDWAGEGRQAAVGDGLLTVVNVDNSGHFHGVHQAFFYIEAGASQLSAIEVVTRDAWRSWAFGEQRWKIAFPKA